MRKVDILWWLLLLFGIVAVASCAVTPSSGNSIVHNGKNDGTDSESQHVDGDNDYSTSLAVVSESEVVLSRKKRFFRSIGRAISRTVRSVTRSVSRVVRSVGRTVGRVARTAWNGARNIVQGARNTVSTFVSHVGNAVRNTIGWVSNTARRLVGGLFRFTGRIVGGIIVHIIRPICWSVYRLFYPFRYIRRSIRVRYFYRLPYYYSPVCGSRPIFTFCPADRYGRLHPYSYPVDTGYDTARVTWDDYRIRRSVRGSYVRVYRYGSSSGSRLSIGTYIVRYKAIDYHGNYAYCTFRFAVTAPSNTCSRPATPQNGNPVGFPGSSVYERSRRITFEGQTAQFSCQSCYEMDDGDEPIQFCRQSREWSGGGTVNCRRISCDSPTLPENVVLQNCDNGNYCNSVCRTECAAGYSQSDPMVDRITCLSTGQWNAQLTPCRDLTPPDISCPESITAYTERLLEGATVTWEVPSAQDTISDVEVTRTTGLPPNSFFSISDGTFTHPIVYTARDSNGNEATCQFNIIIEDIPCAALPSDESMEIDCSNENRFGSQCTFSCEQGYHLTGAVSSSCERNNADPPQANWDYGSGDAPECTLISCEAPSVPDTVTLVECTNNYIYGSRCDYECVEGYSPAEQSQDHIQCNEDGEWSAEVTPCTDTTPPVVTFCPDSINEYTDWQTSGATATWSLPTGEDNLGSVTVTQTEGQSPGAFFSIAGGVYTYTISYDISDAAGNQAPPCTFTVNIQDIPCSAIEVTAGLSMTCTHGNIYGSNCSFSCGSTQLTGAPWAVCQRNSADPPEAAWDYNGHDSPQCEIEGCEDLAAPANGAVACLTLVIGRQCTMSCNSNFTPLGGPGDYTGLAVCPISTGEWDRTFPDCEPIHPITNRALTDVELYFDGVCEDSDEIQQRFFDMLQSSQYNTFCTQDSDCSIENVEVTCGESTRRRRSIGIRSQKGLLPELSFKHRTRRTTDRILLSFQLVLELQPTPNSTPEELYESSNTQFLEIVSPFYFAVADGDFNVDGLQADIGSFDFSFPQPGCLSGTIPAVDGSFTCTNCSEGTKYVEGTPSTCQFCPVGTYQEDIGQDHCNLCPNGTSTLRDGAKNISQCIVLCPSGQYSTNGFAPCIPCARNTYQPLTGQNSCSSCPEGLNTTGQGSTTETQCFSIENGPCSTQPCGDGGDCVQRENAYTCHCRPGYHGVLCDEFTDPCLASPCLNGGTCQAIGPASYRCDCLAGTNGTRCQMLTNPQCQRGSMINSRTGACELCPVGTFQHETNQNSCFDCPTGFSTVSRGASAASRCLGFCPIGKYSSTGVLPCLPCPRNSFQNVTGQRECTACPDDLITMGPGSSSLDDCYSLDAGPCSQSPCINGGSCTQWGNAYACLCLPGFQGINCQTYSDPCIRGPCQNNGSCESTGPTAFTCHCSDNTLGTLCEVLRVDGVWASWEEWTDCSVECDSGSRTRVRECDNPAPQNGGQTCDGEDEEIEGCNEHECPSCPELTAPDNSEYNCTENDEGDIDCTVECDDGFSISNSEIATISCGPSYDYQWTLDEDRGSPSCIENRPPDTIKVEQTITVPVTSELSPDDHDSLREQGEDYVASRMSCIGAGTCSASVETDEGDERRRRKRQTGDTEGVDLTITLTINTGDDSNNDASEETMTAALTDISSFVESFADDLTNGTLTLTVGGIELTISPDSFSMEMDLECDDPLVPFEGMCVNCPAGSHKHESECRECPLGHYQPEEGQLNCLQCPDGQTTTITSATRASNCVAIQQDVCIPGTYNNSGECMLCPPGHYSVEEGAMSCNACAIATYQDTSGQTTCFPCDEDHITRSEGSTSADDCYIDESLCPAGTYTSETGCTLCAIGYFTELPGRDSCEQCPDNQTTISFGSSSQDECDIIERECPAGTYGDGITCEPCPIGEYQDEAGQSACIPCQNGHTTLTVESDTSEDCLLIQDSCDAGYYAFGGVCGICPFGYYQPQTDQRLCLACSNGLTTEVQGATNVSQCIPVERNNDDCVEGHYLDDDVCTLCPLGSYQPEIEQTSCIQCDEHETTETTGSADPDDCVLIDEDACVAGTHIDGDTCVACPIGEYQPHEDQYNCIECADGYTTSTMGSTASSDCIHDTDTSSEEESDSAGEADRQTSKKGQSGNSDNLLILPIVLSVVAVVAVVVIIVIVIKNLKRQPTSPQSTNHQNQPTDPPPAYAAEIELEKPVGSMAPLDTAYIPPKKNLLPLNRMPSFAESESRPSTSGRPRTANSIAFFGMEPDDGEANNENMPSVGE